jgi:hypothetical protein
VMAMAMAMTQPIGTQDVCMERCDRHSCSPLPRAHRSLPWLWQHQGKQEHARAPASHPASRRQQEQRPHRAADRLFSSSVVVTTTAAAGQVVGVILMPAATRPVLRRSVPHS